MAGDQIQLIKFSLISLIIIFFNPVNAICVARHLTDLESALLTDSASVSASPAPKTAPAESPKAGSTNTPNGNKLLADVVSKGPINLQVQKICEGVEYPAICIASLAPIFNGNTQPLALVETLTRAVIAEFKVANATVAKMASQPGADLGAVDQCIKVYDDALYDLDSALESLKTNDIPTIQTMLSSSIAMAGTCDDGFTGQPDPDATGVSPMAAVNEHLINMAANVLSIANNIPY